MGKHSSYQIKKHDTHNGQKDTAGQGIKKQSEIILGGTSLFAELRMDFVIGQLRRGGGMAVNAGANLPPVVFMGDGVRIRVAQHLVDGFTRFNVAVKAIGDSFTEKVGRFAMKSFTVRVYRFGGQIMPCDDLGIIMAASTYLGNVSGVSDFM